VGNSLYNSGEFHFTKDNFEIEHIIPDKFRKYDETIEGVSQELLQAVYYLGVSNGFTDHMKVTSGFRTYDHQMWYFNNQGKYGIGRAAYPGERDAPATFGSLHQTSNAIDIYNAKEQLILANTNYSELKIFGLSKPESDENWHFALQKN
jgi:hypothetical protein